MAMVGNKPYGEETELNCVLCAPFKWVFGCLGAGCEEVNAAVQARLTKWDYAQANDRELWDREPAKDRANKAFSLFQSDQEAGFRQLLALAENGSVWSMLWVASCYEHGKGVPLDPAEAEQWYRRAFEGGSERAQLAYTRILGLRKELARCEEVLSVGAANDWAPALYWLARYRMRRSQSRETALSVRPMLERAAAKGSLAAQKLLVRLMLRGRYGLREIPRGVMLMLDTVGKLSALAAEAETTAEQTLSQHAPNAASVSGDPTDEHKLEAALL